MSAPRPSTYERILRAGIVFSFGLTVLAGIAGVAFRYIPPISHLGFWTDDAVRYSFIWAVFLAAAAATRQKLHIAVDLLPSALCRRHREWLEAGISLLCLGFVIVLGLGGIQAAKVSAESTSWSTTEVSRAWAYVAVPVGSFLMACEFGRIIVRTLRATAPVSEADSREAAPLEL